MLAWANPKPPQGKLASARAQQRPHAPKECGPPKTANAAFKRQAVHHPYTRGDVDAANQLKLGDNSIYPTNNLGQLICGYMRDAPSQSNYYSSAATNYPQWGARFADVAVGDAAGYTVSTPISRVALGGTGFHDPVDRGACVFPTAAAPIPAAQRQNHTVEMGPARKVGELDRTRLDPFKNGGVPEERRVGAAVVGKLGHIPRDVQRSLGSALDAPSCPNPPFSF